VMAPAGRPASGVMSGYVSDAVCRLDRLSTLVLADWKQISGPIPACVATSLPYLRILELPGTASRAPSRRWRGCRASPCSTSPTTCSPARRVTNFLVRPCVGACIRTCVLQAWLI
jgi:hypothetical protein